MKNQVLVVRRRMSRTDTGKTYIYSVVGQGNDKVNRKRSVVLTTQKMQCEPDGQEMAHYNEQEVFLIF